MPCASPDLQRIVIARRRESCFRAAMITRIPIVGTAPVTDRKPGSANERHPRAMGELRKVNLTGRNQPGPGDLIDVAARATVGVMIGAGVGGSTRRRDRRATRPASVTGEPPAGIVPSFGERPGIRVVSSTRARSHAVS